MQMSFPRNPNFSFRATMFQNLSTLKELPPKFFQSLFKHAGEYFEKEPWNICNIRDVIEIQAYGQSRVMQQRSNWADIAIRMWEKFEHYWDMFNPVMGDTMANCTENTILTHKPKDASFEFESDIDPVNMEFIRCLGLHKSGTTFYPMFMGYVGPELEVIDFKFFELCFMLFPEFCAKLEPETPYELAPLQEEKTVTDGMRESVIVK